MTSPPGSVSLIAVIDSNAGFRNDVANALMSLYRVSQHDDASRALDELRANPPTVMLVDEELRPSGGIEFITRARRIPQLATVPAVLTSRHSETVLGRAAKDGGVTATLTKPFRRSVLIKLVTSLINKSVEASWEALPELHRKTLTGTVEAFNNIADFIANGEPVPLGPIKDACAPLVQAVGSKDFKGILNGVKEHDNYSFAHSLRVATLLTLFGNTVGLKPDDQLVLASGGLLHDAGKMQIPHEVLNKPGRLTEEEFVVMKSHVTHTITFLEASPEITKPMMIIAAQHHEKLDGTGYPFGLKGGELNDLARMAAIVDVFSALTDRRVYKPPMEAEEALDIMTGPMGNHLDQHYVATFRAMLMDAVIST